MVINAIAPKTYNITLFFLDKLVLVKSHPAIKYVVNPPKKSKFKFSKMYVYVADALFIKSTSLLNKLMMGFVNWNNKDKMIKYATTFLLSFFTNILSIGAIKYKPIIAHMYHK